jgi:hypothetical protein
MHTEAQSAQTSVKVTACLRLTVDPSVATRAVQGLHPASEVHLTLTFVELSSCPGRRTASGWLVCQLT